MVGTVSDTLKSRRRVCFLQDKDELIAEYGFTEEEAEDVAAELAAIEADAQ